MTDSVDHQHGRLVWVDSGSGPGHEVQVPEDGRPAFSPLTLVTAIQRVLRDRGVYIEPSSAQLYTAVIAAADLLRALGVRPTNP